MSRITTLAAMISLAAVYTFGYQLVPWPTTIVAPDWDTWIGAIGTVGTLVGTLYIATSETRRRRSEEATRANITAAALMPRAELLAQQLREFQIASCSGTQPAIRIRTLRKKPAIYLQFVTSEQPLKNCSPLPS